MAQAAVIAHDDHHYTSTGLSSWKVGFWTFIGSECLFFATLISTYMVYKGRSLVGPYPEEILNIPLTSVSTFVLLMSSLAMVLALDAVQRGNKKRLSDLAGRRDPSGERPSSDSRSTSSTTSSTKA